MSRSLPPGPGADPPGPGDREERAWVLCREQRDMLCWFTESRPTAAAAPGSLILRGCAPALLCLGAGVCAESSGPRGAVSRPAASASPAKSPGTPALTQPPSPAPGTWELRPGNRCIVGPSGGSAADWSLGPWSGRWVSVRDNPAPRGRPARSGDTGGQNRDGPGGRQQSSRRPAGQDSTWGLIRPGRDRCPLEAWPGACGARKTGGRPPRPPPVPTEPSSPAVGSQHREH